MKSREFVTYGIVAAVVLLLAGGCTIDGEWGPRVKFERTIELQHGMPAGATLAVSTPSGSIHAKGEETDEAHVVATIQARAATEEEARDLAEQVEIRFEEAANRLALKADVPVLHNHRSISISYQIAMPRQAGIECDSASGSIDVAGLEGNVKAHSASGSVKAGHIKGSVRLTSASGSVRCEKVEGGDAYLDTASGGVRLSDASNLGACELHSSSGSAAASHVQAGSIRASSASGSVVLTDAQAKTINLHSSSGSVKAESVACTRLSAESVSGNVTVAFRPTAPSDVVADMSSGSGSVYVVTPKGFTGRLEISTVSGSVETNLPVTVKGRLSKRQISGFIGEGSGSITARTASGSVRVR